MRYRTISGLTRMLPIIMAGCVPNIENIISRNGNNQPPVAQIRVIRGQVEGEVPFQVSFTGYDSYDPDDPGCRDDVKKTTCLKFSWSYAVPQSEENPTLYWPRAEQTVDIVEPGNYQIWLKVTDRDGDSNTTSVDVKGY